MAREEAIKELKRHKETLNLWDCIPLENLQSFDIAIEALEKQIPKKIIYKETQYGDFASCPVCESVVYSQPFCGDCGQALDWTEEGE